jgi:superfamily II DNA helicase RecQ
VTLVISPLLSLIQDQVDQWNGSVSEEVLTPIASVPRAPRLTLYRTGGLSSCRPAPIRARCCRRFLSSCFCSLPRLTLLLQLRMRNQDLRLLYVTPEKIAASGALRVVFFYIDR